MDPALYSAEQPAESFAAFLVKRAQRRAGLLEMQVAWSDRSFPAEHRGRMWEAILSVEEALDGRIGFEAVGIE